MSSSVVLNFVHPEQYERSVRAADVRVAVTAPGAFRAKLTRIDLGRLWMQRAQISLPTVTHSTLKKHRTMIFLQFDPDQASILNSGVEVSPSEIVCYPSGSEHHYRTSASYSCGGMSLPHEDLAAISEVLVGRELTAPATTRVMRPSPALMKRLLRLHKAVADLAESAPDILAHPQVSKAIEQELVGAMIACVAHPLTQEKSLPNLRALQRMRSFEQILEAHKDEPLYLTDVCLELGVTDRTLRLHCQEHLGMSPHQYLWLRRMNLARRALTLANPGAKTVTEIANDHGFAELGRFAVTYRKLFGERPSATLRRA